ncbi:MAG: tRNA pseudouridine(38-40) synthase TruA [Nannocystaceae bacterium]
MSVVLRVAYDGTDFHGFARQRSRPDGRPLPTVQGALEEALAGLYGAPILTRGASRTDAGVHARGQVVAFDPPFAIPARGLLLGLAGRLPATVVATSAWEEAGADGGPLEPRRHNLGKRYQYVIRCAGLRDPLGQRFEWHRARRLDLAAMRAAAERLVGERDFASFRAAACQATTTVRRIHAVTVAGVADGERLGDPELVAGGPCDRVVVDVDGQAFLHNMVRIIVGTLVEVGDGRRPPAWIDEVLAARDRRRAGITAPAHGLTLLEVRWPRPAADEPDPRGSVG